MRYTLRPGGRGTPITPTEAAPRSRRGLVPIALLAVLGLAFALRALGFEQVFVGDDEVVFWFGDSYFHLRRALYSLVRFPEVLEFDSYLNYPDGARVPIPPLYPLLLAALGRLAGGDLRGLEVASAWAAPLWGSLSVLPVFAAARLVAGSAAALGAAAIYALLPVSVYASAVGNADYHALVALLGASWLATSMASLGPDRSTRQIVLLHLGLALLRWVVLLLWPGSLLYLLVGEGSLLLVGSFAASARQLVAHAAGLLASAAAALPMLLATPTPAGGMLSSLTLSALHLGLLAAVAAAAVVLAWLEGRRPGASFGRRVARLGALAAVAMACLLVVPSLREGLLGGLSFVSGGVSHHAGNVELVPLFRSDPQGRWVAPTLYGGFAYLIPLVPVLALLRARDPSRRSAALVLALWATALGALAVFQKRYGSDFAPSAAVGFALLLDSGYRLARGRLPRAAGTALAWAVGVVLLLPPILWVHAAQLRGSLAASRETSPRDRALATPTGSLLRMARHVRTVTPETSGFLEPEPGPEYGILCNPAVGHMLQYAARRASPAGNFLGFVGTENLHATLRFFALASEARAVALAGRLGTRYVLTDAGSASHPGSVVHRLHYEDGLGREGLPRLEHMRLVTEGPRGGLPLSELMAEPGQRNTVPYKLFEIVQGAVLEARAEPGSEVEARIEIRTPFGRRFVYAATQPADASGVARLRVPYASLGDAPARPVGPYRVRAGGLSWAVAVSEAQVREGAHITVGSP